MWGLQPFLPQPERLDTGGRQSGREQRSLDRIRWLAREDHVFHMQTQRIKEVRLRVMSFTQIKHH